MTETIQTTLAPLLLIGSFCSLGLFEYPVGQSKPYLTYLYILSSWSFFIYFYHYLLDVTNMPFNITLVNATVMSAAIISMLVSLFRFKELQMCINKLSKVDDTLEVLGTPKKYQRLRNWIIGMIIGWIALSFFMNTFDSLILSYKQFNIARVCFLFLALHFFHVNSLSALIWAVLLGYTSSRFQQVNESIHLFNSDLLEDNTLYQKSHSIKRQNRFTFVNRINRRIEAKERKQYMWIIMHVHLQLTLVSRELNKVFKIQMSLQMISYFVCIVITCRDIYLIYSNMMNKYASSTSLETILEKALSYSFGILYSIIIIALNNVCQNVYHKANDTIIVLYRLSNCNLDEDLYEQILQFILQIKQREIKFGMGLLSFGNSFIRQFYTSVLTILVIMIQMNYTDKETLY